MSIRVGILADDLSGGMNIGGEFAQAGYRTVLLARAFDTAEADVLIINTESRHLPPENAYQTTHDAAGMLQPFAPEMIVKKIDSLMRGSVGQEVQAVMDALGYVRCLLTPASPKLNRQVIGDTVLVGGHLLAEQQHLLDPLGAVKTSRVTHILSGQTQRPVIPLDIDTIRQGESAIIRALETIDAGIIAADCMTQQDLIHTIQAAYAQGIRFFAGTYGMGEALCAALETETKSRVLVVVGSLSAAAQRQVDFLRSHAHCVFVQPEYDPSFFDQSPGDFAMPYAIALQAENWRAPVSLVQVAAASPVIDTLLDMGRARGYHLLHLHARVEQMMQAIITPSLGKFAGFVATGGATAASLFGLLDGDGFTLESPEIIPGVALARVRGGAFDGRPFVVKPGSQGDDDALLRLVWAVQRNVQGFRS